MAISQKSKPVNVSAKLRKASPWFEEGAERAKDGAIKKRRVDFETQGSKLKTNELVAIADELEEIQRKLNPLLTRHEELSAPLLAHWGHTGIEEIEGTLGKTLFSTSVTLSVDPDAIEKGLTEGQWRTVTKRLLDAKLALAMGERDEIFRSLIIKTIKASAKVTITPPSSRRPKSGETGEDE